MEITFFILGFVGLIGGAEIFVKGASAIAGDLRISPVVIGLTVVAFGTSAPELAVTLEGVYTGNVDVAVGNVLGSNIANILVIVGLCALAKPLAVHWQFIRFEIPFLIAITLAFWALSADGMISVVEGWFMFASAVGYTVYTVRNALRERREKKRQETEDDGHEARQMTIGGVVRNMLLIIAGFVLLVVGSKGIVAGAVQIATLAGMDQLAVGLTIVAIGTSLPEVAMSVAASRKDEGEMIIGNVVGSNLFNILVVAGLGAALSFKGLPVTSSAMNFDFPFMCAVTIGLLPAAFAGGQINRWEGVLFLGFYVAYTIYLVLDARGHPAVPTFTLITFYIGGPLALLAIVITAVRHRVQTKTSS
jgi:cation:H+ antiporter